MERANEFELGENELPPSGGLWPDGVSAESGRPRMLRELRRRLTVAGPRAAASSSAEVEKIRRRGSDTIKKNPAKVVGYSPSASALISTVLFSTTT